MNNIDSVIKQIAAACGIEEKNVIVNDLYLLAGSLTASLGSNLLISSAEA